MRWGGGGGKEVGNWPGRHGTRTTGSRFRLLGCCLLGRIAPLSLSPPSWSPSFPPFPTVLDGSFQLRLSPFLLLFSASTLFVHRIPLCASLPPTHLQWCSVL